MSRSRARRRSVLAFVTLTMGAVLSVESAVAQTSTPTFVRTIGGPRHAAIYPGGLDVDEQGNVYIADTGNDRVEMYPASSNTPTWVRGIRGASYAQGNFVDPRDTAVDDAFVYVADTGHGVVQILDRTDGSFVQLWSFGWRSPIGISVGTDGLGHERILVSNGGTGNVNVFDGGRNLLFTIPPRLGGNAGTRDAATDPSGNIYVADYRHDQVHKYSRNGAYLLSWGGATAPTCAKIPRPYGVDVDDAGRVYIAASNSNKVRSFQGDGTCVRSYGSYGTGEFQVTQVRRVAVTGGPNPKIHVADLWGIKDLIFNLDGSVFGRLGSWPKPSPGGFNQVPAVAVTDSYVFAPDVANHRAERFDLDGSDPIAWGTKGVTRGLAHFNWPQGIAVNPATGNVWVVDTRNSDLKEFSPSGSGPIRTVGSLGSSPGQLRWPVGMAFDGVGNAYVADSSNNRVQSFGPAWGFRWTYGSAGSGLSNLRRPTAVYHHAATGRLYVADTSNSRIVVLKAATGERISILPIAKGTGPGQIRGPEGVAVSPAGDVWVADTQNNRIQAFTPAGAYTGVSVGGLGFGSGTMQFNHPTGLAFGAGGLLYVADTWNDRIQVFSV